MNKRIGEGKDPTAALLDSMGGHEFEDLVERLLGRMGFQIEGRQGSADGGIDMMAINVDPISGGRFVIQCKRQSLPISESKLRELHGVVHAESANKGVLITNATFSRESIQFARDKPLELIDGAKLQFLLAQYKILSALPSQESAALSPGLQIMYSKLAIPLKTVIEESVRTQQGLTFVPVKTADVKTYQKLVRRQMARITGGIQTLAALTVSVTQVINVYDASPEELSLLRINLNEILKICRSFLKDQREARGVVPPEIFSTYHAYYLQIMPELLLAMLPLAEFPKNAVELGLKGGHHEIRVDLTSPSLDKCAKELNRVNESIERQKSGSACFIATAAYGSELDERVQDLRLFRENILRRNYLGRCFVDFYENHSPRLARIVEMNSFANWLARALLYPVIWFVGRINRLWT